MKRLNKFVGLFFTVGLLIGLITDTFAQRFSEGDRVVVIRETSVFDGSSTIAKLPPETNFRVSSTNASYVGISQAIKGKELRGWVRQRDVLKIGKDKIAVFVKEDKLVAGQGRRVPIPGGIPIFVQIESDYAIDLLVLDEENTNKYINFIKNGGKGKVKTVDSAIGVKRHSFDWGSLEGEKNFLIIDNTRFPSEGTNSQRKIQYSIAFCLKEDPQPKGPQRNKGIVIGRATVDYDNYDGKNGRERRPFKVLLDVIDTEDNVVESIEAPVDQKGYFFFENLELGYTYRAKKLDASGFGAPISYKAEIGFGMTDEEDGKLKKTISVSGMTLTRPCVEPAVVDMGHMALKVNEKGQIQTRIDSADISATNKDGGGVTVLFMDIDTPLDRHDWFLKKFPESGWIKSIKRDRDSIYEKRKEAQRKKKEKGEAPPEAPVPVEKDEDGVPPPPAPTP